MHRLVTQPVVDVEATDLQNRLPHGRTPFPAAGRESGDGGASTGVKPIRMRTVCPDAVLILDLPMLRSRGLTNSSMPKLTRDNAVPSSAIASPAGTNHHQAPCAR